MQYAIIDIYLMYYVEELKKERSKATGLCVWRVVTAMTKSMSKCQPLFLDKRAETIEGAIEWIEH